MLGPLADPPRKNCWSIAEWAGETTPDGHAAPSAATPRWTGNSTFRAPGPPPPTSTPVRGKPLLATDFDNTYWFPIREGADERAPRPRYERWARPALPAVEGRMGRELPGVAGVCSKVTPAMEERIVGYLQRVWEKEVVGAGLWTPSFPILLPGDPAKSAPPQFSGLPTLEYE